MSTSTMLLKQVNESPNFRFVDMIKESSLHVLIPILNSTTTINISSSSVLKIISLISPSHDEDIELVCCTYVTCRINDMSLYSDTESSCELDPVFAKLLNESKSFCVTPARTVNNGFPNSCFIIDYSLHKISKMIGTTITRMSDFITIAIFIFANDELHERQRSLNRLSLRANILEKYSHTKPKTLINGISLFNTNAQLAKKNPLESIEHLDTFLINADNFIKGKPQLHLENNVKKILDLSEIHNKTNNDNNNNNNRSYIQHKKLLFSRQKVSRKQDITKSPDYIYSNNHSKHKRSSADLSDYDLRDAIQFEEKIKTKTKINKLNKINKPPSHRRKSHRNNNDNDDQIKNIFVLKDNEGNCVFVPDRSFSLLVNAYEKGKIKIGMTITVQGDDGNVVQIASYSINDAIHNDDNKMVKIKDLFGNYVIVNKKEFFKEIESTKKEGNNCVEMEDFSGQRVYIQIPLGMINMKKINKPNKLYCVQLARIEINDISKCYTNIGDN